MLPFLKPRRETGIVIRERKPDGDISMPQEEGDEGLIMAAEDLIRALNAKDSKAVAQALRAAFEIVDSAPHAEGPHMDGIE